MKHKLLAAAGVVMAMGIGCAVRRCQSAFNGDAAQVVAMRIANLTRRNGRKLPGTTTINREIADLIEASVIHGAVTDGVPTNVWGNSFTVELDTNGGVRCRSPGLFGTLGSSEYTADSR